jgi:hypothetical protein
MGVGICHILDYLRVCCWISFGAGSRLQVRRRAVSFLFAERARDSSVSGPSFVSTSLLANGYRQLFPPDLKRLGREAFANASEEYLVSIFMIEQ